MADRVVYNNISIREMAGREGTNPLGAGDTAERTFLCKGDADPLVCRDALLNQTFYAIDIYDGMPLMTISRERLTDEAWSFTCTYTATAPEPGSYTVTIDTQGGTGKLTEARAQVSYAELGTTPTDYGTSVNVQDKKVQGVDVVLPALKINIQARISSAYASDPIGYAKTIAFLTGKVNVAPYLGFAAKELLFTGASGTIISSSDSMLTFTFEASQNVTGLQVGPITGITKAGHQYLWVEYKKEQDSTSTRTREVARAAYVADVYEAADFTPLQIGVP